MVKLAVILLAYQQTVGHKFMKFPIKTKNFIIALLTSLFMTTHLAGCTDDNSDKTGMRPVGHTHNTPIVNMKKHSFEHKFADQCVKRELKNSINKKADRKRFSKSCLCIATRIMKDLDEVQAEKFLKEKKNTHTMKLNFDEAAYFCLQQNAKPKSSNFSRKIINKPKKASLPSILDRLLMLNINKINKEKWHDFHDTSYLFLFLIA